MPECDGCSVVDIYIHDGEMIGKRVVSEGNFPLVDEIIEAISVEHRDGRIEIKDVPFQSAAHFVGDDIFWSEPIEIGKTSAVRPPNLHDVMKAYYFLVDRADELTTYETRSGIIKRAVSMAYTDGLFAKFYDDEGANTIISYNGGEVAGAFGSYSAAESEVTLLNIEYCDDDSECDDCDHGCADGISIDNESGSAMMAASTRNRMIVSYTPNPLPSKYIKSPSTISNDGLDKVGERVVTLYGKEYVTAVYRTGNIEWWHHPFLNERIVVGSDNLPEKYYGRTRSDDDPEYSESRDPALYADAFTTEGATLKTINFFPQEATQQPQSSWASADVVDISDARRLGMASVTICSAGKLWRVDFSDQEKVVISPVLIDAADHAEYIADQGLWMTRAQAMFSIVKEQIASIEAIKTIEHPENVLWQGSSPVSVFGSSRCDLALPVATIVRGLFVAEYLGADVPDSHENIVIEFTSSIDRGGINGGYDTWLPSDLDIRDQYKIIAVPGSLSPDEKLFIVATSGACEIVPYNEDDYSIRGEVWLNESGDLFVPNSIDIPAIRNKSVKRILDPSLFYINDVPGDRDTVFDALRDGLLDDVYRGIDISMMFPYREVNGRKIPDRPTQDVLDFITDLYDAMSAENIIMKVYGPDDEVSENLKTYYGIDIPKYTPFRSSNNNEASGDIGDGDSYVVYSISADDEGNIIVDYSAYDGSGNDVTDEILTASFGDGVLFYEEDAI